MFCYLIWDEADPRVVTSPWHHHHTAWNWLPSDFCQIILFPEDYIFKNSYITWKPFPGCPGFGDVGWGVHYLGASEDDMGEVLFLATQNDRLILGQCEKDGWWYLNGYFSRGPDNWDTAAQESVQGLILHKRVCGLTRKGILIPSQVWLVLRSVDKLVALFQDYSANIFWF